NFLYRTTGMVPSQNAVCVVFTPPGTVVSNADQGGDSTKAFYAYHGKTEVSITDGAGKQVGSKLYYYIIMPWQASPNAVAPPKTFLEDMTVVFSHELAETVTDPAFGS